MKILFVGTLPPIIGLSPYCLHLTNSLSKKVDLEFIGFKTFSRKSKSFIGNQKIDDLFYTNVLKNLKIKRILNWYNPFSGFKAGSELKGDLIHLQWWIPSLIFVFLPLLIMAKIKKIKIIITIHNILPHEHRIWNLFTDRIANLLIIPLGDFYIVHNKRNKEKFMKIYNVKENKIGIITHGKLNLIQNKNISKKEAMNYLNLPLNKKIILFFGYIRPYKGIDILLESFYLLKNEIKDIFLLIVGQPIDITLKKYQKIIDKYKLNKDLYFYPGFVPENLIQYYFSSSDLVVLPYKHLDTHGGVGAIAVAFNKPLVVTDVGGLPEFVKDRSIIAKPNDVIDLKNKIQLVLQDENIYNKLVNDSIELSKKLNWDDIAEQTVQIYKKMI